MGIEECSIASKEGAKVSKYKEQNFEIPASNVKLPANIKEYFSVESPAKISTTNGMESFSVVFDIICKTELSSVLDEKVKDFMITNRLKKENVRIEKKESFQFDSRYYAGYKSKTEANFVKALTSLKSDEKTTLNLFFQPDDKEDKKR